MNRAAPPTPTKRKNNEFNVAFEDKAKNMERDAMKAKGVTLDQLTERVALIGVEMRSGGVASVLCTIFFRAGTTCRDGEVKRWWVLSW